MSMRLPRDYLDGKQCTGTEWWCNQFGYPNHWDATQLRNIAVTVDDPVWELTKGLDSNMAQPKPLWAGRKGWGVVYFFIVFILFLQYLLHHRIIS